MASNPMSGGKAMGLRELAEIVFRRGCKVSLKKSLQTEAYHALHKEACDLGLVEPEDSALVQLLGTELADRAFQNVPWWIRNKVSTWHDGLPAQMALLELIFDELHGDKWRESETRHYAYNSDARCVLPAETGSWTRGPARPNCLGVAQMMVGFARAVGAPHYLANVIRPNQDTLHALQTRSLKKIADLLRKYDYLDELTAKLDAKYVKELERMNTSNQAHHVLVIQTDDGVWWVVDPYLRALYRLSDNPHRDQALAQLATERNKVLTIDNPSTSINEHLAKAEMRLRILNTMCLLVERFDELLLNDLSHLVAFSWLSQEPITGWDELARTLAFVQVEPSPEQANMADIALVCAALDINDPVHASFKLNQELDETLARFKASKQRAATDPAHKLSVATRLIRFVLQDVLECIDELSHRDDVRYHEGLEICWPTMALGAATLNYMQFENAGSRPPLRGGLARLLPTQWVIYDALVSAEQQGEPIDPSLLAEFEKRLARFKDAPDLMVIPLYLLRTLRKENEARGK